MAAVQAGGNPVERMSWWGPSRTRTSTSSEGAEDFKFYQGSSTSLEGRVVQKEEQHDAVVPPRLTRVISGFRGLVSQTGYVIVGSGPCICDEIRKNTVSQSLNWRPTSTSKDEQLVQGDSELDEDSSTAAAAASSSSTSREGSSSSKKMEWQAGTRDEQRDGRSSSRPRGGRGQRNIKLENKLHNHDNNGSPASTAGVSSVISSFSQLLFGKMKRTKIARKNNLRRQNRRVLAQEKGRNAATGAELQHRTFEGYNQHQAQGLSANKARRDDVATTGSGMPTPPLVLNENDGQEHQGQKRLSNKNTDGSLARGKYGVRHDRGALKTRKFMDGRNAQATAGRQAENRVASNVCTPDLRPVPEEVVRAVVGVAGLDSMIKSGNYAAASLSSLLEQEKHGSSANYHSANDSTTSFELQAGLLSVHPNGTNNKTDGGGDNANANANSTSSKNSTNSSSTSEIVLLHDENIKNQLSPEEQQLILQLRQQSYQNLSLIDETCATYCTRNSSCHGYTVRGSGTTKPACELYLYEERLTIAQQLAKAERERKEADEKAKSAEEKLVTSLFGDTAEQKVDKSSLFDAQVAGGRSGDKFLVQLYSNVTSKTASKSWTEVLVGDDAESETAQERAEANTTSIGTAGREEQNETITDSTEQDEGRMGSTSTSPDTQEVEHNQEDAELHKLDDTSTLKNGINEVGYDYLLPMCQWRVSKFLNFYCPRRFVEFAKTREERGGPAEQNQEAGSEAGSSETEENEEDVDKPDPDFFHVEEVISAATMGASLPSQEKSSHAYVRTCGYTSERGDKINPLGPPGEDEDKVLKDNTSGPAPEGSSASAAFSRSLTQTVHPCAKVGAPEDLDLTQEGDNCKAYWFKESVLDDNTCRLECARNRGCVSFTTISKIDGAPSAFSTYSGTSSGGSTSARKRRTTCVLFSDCPLLVLTKVPVLVTGEEVHEGTTSSAARSNSRVWYYFRIFR
ncbi:unnamed protein product [Amoebophrya sp. A120]|nr:unnamed protein product [Amoebophrya sp. A120]|eukprot:GSA120T00015607001.1